MYIFAVPRFIMGSRFFIMFGKSFLLERWPFTELQGILVQDESYTSSDKKLQTCCFILVNGFYILNAIQA